MKNTVPCKLCGLPVRGDNLRAGSGTDQFCCSGCKMVYAMLMESEEYRGVDDFRQTDLYRRCVEAGVIPDPDQFSAEPQEQESAPVTEVSQATDHQSAPLPPENVLSCTFTVRNMWCPACAWIVEDALRKTKGVVEASCNFSSDRGRIVYDPVKTSPDKLFEIIAKLGYSAASLEKSSAGTVREFVRLGLTLIFTMNIMMFSWSIYSGFIWELSRESIQLLTWPVWVMATIVLIYGGCPIHMRAIAGIRAGTPGMETLITVGSSVSYLYSVFNALQGSLDLYFDASSMLILLILIGKKLEQSAKDKISAGLAGFFSLAPEKVRLCSPEFPNGRYVSVKQLAEGDLFQAEQGELLAADGVIVEGSAVIDESSITGEAKPVRGKVSDRVKSGTRIESGMIRVKATQVGESSVLGKMMTIMEQSLSGKTRQTARFEGLLKYFVPAVIGIAILVFLSALLAGLPTYDALNRGISVIVISCPCALGIAIPLALVAGVSVAGKSGILVKNFDTFERVNGLDTIVFDKTGTLTSGKLRLLDIVTENENSAKAVLELALSLEEASDHYLALAIKSYGRDQNISPLPVESIQIHENGVEGVYKGKRILLGNSQLVPRIKAGPASIPEDQNKRAQVISEIYLSIDDEWVATLQFGDTIRYGVPELMERLAGDRMEIHLVSGDASTATTKAAEGSGIESTFAHGDMLPHEKAAFIRDLKRLGKTVAMVGDGINDAPAMAVSDLAIAVHSGLNPGDDVASITLMKEDPAQMMDFFQLAGRVNRTVKQNLIGALVYNLIGIPVAASGLLNPIIAVTAMLCSSLSVTFNTLRLVRKEIKPR